MFDLDLSHCPICQTSRRLVRQMREAQGQHFIWYECPECYSALLWLGKDRWVYQKVGRTDRQYLLKRPLTTVELQALSVAGTPAAAASTYLRDKPPAKAEPDWYYEEPPVKAEPAYLRDKPPAKAEPDWYYEEPPAKTEPAYYHDEPTAAAGDLYAYEPEPVAEPAPPPAETSRAVRPKGIPKSLVIAVAVIALLCVIAAVLILITQG